MNLEQFATIARERIPTADEFAGLIRGQGWTVRRDKGGHPCLRAPVTDPLALKLAKMLSREPWRTNVLPLFDMPDDARPDVVTTDPKPLPTTAPPKSEWETCATCRADVLAAEMPTAMALCDAPSKCPYRPAEATPAVRYERPSAPSSPSGPARPLIGSRPAPPPPRPDLFAG